MSEEAGLPRYYFDVFDGETIAPDDLGIDCHTDEDAAAMAVEALPDIVHDELPGDPPRDFWVKVRDESGAYIFVADLKFKADWLKQRS